MTDDSICGRRIGAEEEGISDRAIQIKKREVGAGIGEEGGEMGGSCLVEDRTPGPSGSSWRRRRRLATIASRPGVFSNLPLPRTGR